MAINAAAHRCEPDDLDLDLNLNLDLDLDLDLDPRRLLCGRS